MNKCADCRFWNRRGDPLEARGDEESDYEPRLTNKQRCLNVLHANHYDCPGDAAVTALAVVTDGSGYAASFYTEPEFGCVSFEALVAPK